MMIRNLGGRNYWEDISTDGRIILKCTLHIEGCYGVD
jgi:hypothetical protein